MHDDLPVWYTTLHPIYYVVAKLLSFLATVMPFWLLSIKIFKIKNGTYHESLNIANLVFCVLGTVILAYYLFEFIWALNTNFFSVQITYLYKGTYWIQHLIVFLIPFLLIQLFWIPECRTKLFWYRVQSVVQG